MIHILSNFSFFIHFLSYIFKEFVYIHSHEVYQHINHYIACLLIPLVSAGSIALFSFSFLMLGTRVASFFKFFN